MLNRILSNDYPRSKFLAIILLVLLLGLAFAPFIFPGVKALSVAAKVLVFIVLVASFDLLLGYTGIVSFAHTMFFGIGAYGMAIASTRMGATWEAMAVGLPLSIVGLVRVVERGDNRGWYYGAEDPLVGAPAEDVWVGPGSFGFSF